PGMGGTFILPYKLGAGLAHEMMLTGANYRGVELQARGAPFSVLPRASVMERALLIARDLAEKPRGSLVTLKRHLSRHVTAQLAEVVDRELEMHAATFHQDDVGALIERNFGA
ncbi:MAG TPA: enoyl-CoA hydratase-related protein, partial [Caulobacteraceae bacterium]